MISDIALLKELPEAIKGSVEAYVGCVAGASTKEEYLRTVKAAGFRDVEIVDEVSVKGMISNWSVGEPGQTLGISPKMIEEVADSIISMKVQAFKPN